MTPLQRRILLELSGRQGWVGTRDLCDAVGVEHAAFADAKRDLYLGEMISYHPNLAQRDDPYWSITWVGERWLTDHPAVTAKPRRYWFRRWGA